MAHADLFFVTLVLHLSGESEEIDAAIAVSKNANNVRDSSYSVQFAKEAGKTTSVAISGELRFRLTF